MTGTPVPLVSVIVATFGDEKWTRLAEERALPSARAQSVEVEVIYRHEVSLHQARNFGAGEAQGRYLIFLDADDELSPDYAEKMIDAAGSVLVRSDHRHWLFQPATLGVVGEKEDPFSVVIPQKHLLDGNFMVIGTMLSKELFEGVGGFADWPLYEDWDLWIRCWRAGAGFKPVPEAVYRVHVTPGSRNMPNRQTQMKVYNAIRRQYL